MTDEPLAPPYADLDATARRESHIAHTRFEAVAYESPDPDSKLPIAVALVIDGQVVGELGRFERTAQGLLQAHAAAQLATDVIRMTGDHIINACGPAAGSA